MMRAIHVRDVPDHIYRRLTNEAKEQRRSLAGQVIAVLARGLNAAIDAKGRRRMTLEAIRADRIQTRRLTDPAKLICEDRKR
jgi:hypothetical protein